MDWKRMGNLSAGLLFLVVAIWDFNHDTSGIGVVFVVLGGVFLGLGLRGKIGARESRPTTSDK